MKPVIIVGAGIAGLSCAYYLNRAQLPFIIVEAGDTIGGRVATIVKNGFLLDHGFQVILDSYNELNEVLPGKHFSRCYFDSAASVALPNGKFDVLAHPFKPPSSIFQSFKSSLWSTRDVLPLLKLLCRQQSADWYLETVSSTTHQFLSKLGLSQNLLEHFLHPFFGGVFLDRDLEVRSDFFIWLLQQFFRGRAYLPAGGMRMLPARIASQFSPCTLQTGVGVRALTSSRGVVLDDGSEIEGRAVVLACGFEASKRLLESIGDLRLAGEHSTGYRSTICHYFRSAQSVWNSKRILLNAKPGCLINSLHSPSAICPDYAPAGQSLLSVTTWPVSGIEKGELLTKVTAELGTLLNVSVDALEHLETITVPQALPKQWPVKSDSPENSYVTLAGDFTTYPSLNGAALSGKVAARQILLC
jgi:protoporphyrinogen oxidase